MKLINELSWNLRASYLVTTILDFRSEKNGIIYDPQEIITVYKSRPGLIVAMCTGDTQSFCTEFGAHSYVGGHRYDLAFRVTLPSKPEDIERLKNPLMHSGQPILLNEEMQGNLYPNRRIFLPAIVNIGERNESRLILSVCDMGIIRPASIK